MTATIDTQSSIVEESKDAKQIMREFAQALHVLAKAGEFIAEDRHYTRMYAAHLIPQVRDMDEDGQDSVEESVRFALDKSAEKVGALATAILAMIG